MFTLKRIKKLIAPLLVVLFLSSSIYSQQAILNNKGDTTICFSIAQSKFLLKQINGLKQCDSLHSICETQLTYCDSISESNKRIQQTMSALMKTDREILMGYKYKIQSLENSIEEQKDKIKAEKNKKRLWMGATALISSIFGYYVLTH